MLKQLSVEHIDGPPGAERNPALRIAMVFASDFDRASAGGIMTLLRELIVRLSARYRVLFVGVGRPGDEDAVRRRVGVRSLAVSLVAPPRHKPSWLPLNALFTFGLFRKRGEVCRTADVIHVHRMETALPFVIGKKKPIVLTVHGSSKFHALTQTGPLGWSLVRAIYDLVEGFVFSRVDRVVLVSGEAYDYYAGRHPGLRRKFAVIPNFVELSEFQQIDRPSARAGRGLAETDLAVVYAGRLVIEKRVDALIEAFAQIVLGRPQAKLFIAGEGPDEPRLRRHVLDKALNHVHFLGLLAKSDAHRLLAAADVLVLPSRFEGFPMVVLEALAYGVPVVASDVGGIREILDEELNRFVWRSGHPGDLAQLILTAAARGPQLRDACRARARQFDSSQVLPRLEAVYAAVASGSGRSRCASA